MKLIATNLIIRRPTNQPKSDIICVKRSEGDFLYLERISKRRTEGRILALSFSALLLRVQDRDE